jgi:hypothetical protein
VLAHEEMLKQAMLQEMLSVADPSSKYFQGLMQQNAALI